MRKIVQSYNAFFLSFIFWHSHSVTQHSPIIIVQMLWIKTNLHGHIQEGRGKAAPYFLVLYI